MGLGPRSRGSLGRLGGFEWAMRVAVVVAALGYARADIYLNNPRGSNNKLSEQSNTRDNNNRLFDSQNNADAGYQIGDDCKPVCQENNGRYDPTKGGAMKGQMYYYQGSDLYVEWTAQHGCGLGNPNVICQLVLQYMCEAENPDIRDGYKRGNQNTAGGQQEPPNPVEAREPNLGQHETYEYYMDCKRRERNKGLYTADQGVSDQQGATATRQNPGGNANANNRHGLECPEERDYYPYWHPSPWHDIAILTDEPLNRCQYYQNQSQNVRGRGFCSLPEHNNPKSCESAGGRWEEKAGWGEPPPECLAGVQSRDNHHGNTRGGQPHYYMWRIPYHAEGTCVLRLRYNITTGDFHGGSIANGRSQTNVEDYFDIDAKYNSKPILRQDPRADFLGLGEDYTLQLQVNTNQYGRVFEDRTHTFKIVKRPLTHILQGNPRIVNYNVRGRRGNIVQVYPSVEYDFVPTELTVEQGTYLHFQWTGSDANDLNNAGNGRAGTDRSNLVQISSRQENVPITSDEHSIVWGDLLKKFAYLDQSSIVSCNKDDNNDQSISNCKQLNGASAYFDGGLVQVHKMGTFHVMCTRNNDFSNRSHKATITVIKAQLRLWQKELGAVLLVCILAFGVYLAAALYALRRPQSWLFAQKNRPRILQYLVDPEVIEQKESERKAYIEDERRMLLGVSSTERRPDGGSSLDAVATTGDLSVPFEKYGGRAKGVCLKLMGCCGLEQGQELFVVAYSVLNLALFAAGFLTHNKKGFLSHVAYPIAKGGGYMLNLNLAMVILPTLKSLQTALHGKGGLAREWIPLDDPIKFHRTIGFMIGFSSIVHVLAHIVHMKVVAAAPKLQQDVLGVYDLTFEEQIAGTPMKEQLQGYKMLTGVLLTLGFLVLFVAASSWFRRRSWGFRLFQRSHAIWPLLYLVLLVHGSQRTWIFLFFPALFIAVDRLARMQGQQHPGVLLTAKLLPKDVIHLTFEPLEGFTYQAGQYILLGWEGEWHPFTLTSAPEESVISVHIRCPRTLDWCHALRRRLITECPARAKGDDKVGSGTPEPEPGTAVSYTRLDLPGGITCCRPRTDAAGAGAGGPQMRRGATELMEKSLHDRIEEAGAVLLKIAGPFGAPAQRVWEFGPIVVVGAGIGVTPFVSIMRSAQLRAQQRAAILGMAKVDDSSAAAKERQKKIRQRKKEAALDTAEAEKGDAEGGSGGGGSSKVGAAISWFKRKAGRKQSAAKGGSSGSKERPPDSSPSSGKSGPKEGEDWNPEGLAELVQDVIPVPTKIHFYWIVRSQEELDWFYDLLASAVDGAASGIAEVHYFTTQEVETQGVRALPCACKQYSGRPNWGPIFQGLAQEHKGENVGVFLCGNPAIGEELASQSREHSDPPDAGPERTHFSFFKEHF